MMLEDLRPHEKDTLRRALFLWSQHCYATVVELQGKIQHGHFVGEQAISEARTQRNIAEALYGRLLK